MAQYPDLVLPEDRWALFDYTQHLFDDRMQDIAERGERLYTTWLSKLNDVMAAATDIADIDAAEVTFDDVADPTLTQDLPVPPDEMDALVFDWPVKPADIPPVTVDISGIAVPDSDITLPLTYVSPGSLAYASNLLTRLRAKLLDDLTDGVTGLDSAVEDSIWNRNYERDLQTRADSIARVAAEWSKRGWPLPDGMLSQMVNEVEVKFNDKRQDASREIAIKQADMAFQNTQQRIASGIELEKVEQGTWQAVEARFFEAAKATIAADIGLYDSQIKRFNALAEMYKILVTAEIEEAKAIVEVYTSQVTAYGKQVDAEAARTKGLVDAYVAEVTAYRTRVEAYSSYNELQLKIYDGRIREALAKADIAIKNAEIQIRNSEMKETLEVKILEVIVGALTQLEAGLLSSINLSARVDASNSSSYSYDGPASLEEIYGDTPL